MELERIEQELDRLSDKALPPLAPKEQRIERAQALLDLADATLEQWLMARGETPTTETREGFRLLSLHRQGAKGEPSFNACRETCREVAYHYNLLTRPNALGGEDPTTKLKMMNMLVRHLQLFVSGKLQQAGLGDFCCASRPIRTNEN